MPGSPTGSIGVEYALAAGARIACRRRRGAGPTTVFVHGVPTDSRQWLPFLERAEGDVLAPDLPGFGLSERPPAADFDYSIGGLTRTLRELLDNLGVGGYRLVVQDWGALSLVAALAEPKRVERLVVLNSVPLSAAYGWHRTARIWRTRGLGELQLAAVTRPAIAFALREARPSYRPMPADFVDMVWSNLRSPATQRAILALYRSADPGALAAAGAGLERVSCPTLVLWGGADPYIATRFGREAAARLPNAELAVLDDAGHWPWLDRADVVDRTLSFLAGRPSDLDSGQ